MLIVLLSNFLSQFHFLPDRTLINTSFLVALLYGTPEETFPFRYLSEKKLKQEN